MEKSMPRRGELCECEKGKGRVADRNMLTQMVTLSLEDGGIITLHASELKYRLRGKAPELKKVIKEEAPVEEFSYFPPIAQQAAAPAPATPEKNEQNSGENDKNNNKRRNHNRRNNKRRNNNHKNHDNSGQRNNSNDA